MNFKDNFDKILLAALFLVVLAVATALTLTGAMDEGSLDWARSVGNLVLGGLLGLITGKLTNKPPEGGDK